MFRAQRAAFVFMAVALDVSALVVAFLLTLTVRSSLGEFLVWTGNLVGYDAGELVRKGAGATGDISPLFSPVPFDNIRRYLWFPYLSIPAWLYFLRSQNGYDPFVRRGIRQELGMCAYAGLLGTVVVMVFMVLMKLDISRLLLIGYLITGVGFLWLTRAVVLPATLRRGRQPARHLLLVGPHSAARRFSGVLRAPAYRWSRMLGYVWDESFEEKSTYAGPERRAAIPHLGTMADLSKLLDREVIDEVVLVRPSGDWATSTGLAMPNGSANMKWSDVLELCLERGRTVSLVDDLVPPVGAKVEATMTGTLPTLVLHNTPQNTLALSIKSLMDRSVAFVALIMLMPLLSLIGLLIKKHDGGPVLFKQKRVGLNGRLFTFYKFRSMHIDAPDILERMKRDEPERYRAINVMEEPFFKAKDGDDPRITPIGRFIRKYSLDELPQFWNVLRGDMSLVGPRPPLPKEVDELEPWQRRKLSVKGGLTCIWQATGRNNTTEVDEWMRMDLEYIDNWSLWLDVKLLFQTVRAVIKREGAS